MYIDERHFVKTAIQKMDLLEQVWTACESNGHPDLARQSSAALDAIKAAAASVQARGVYRAAILCEDVLSRLTPDNTVKMNSALVELHRLVHLYANGLFEIDPEFATLLHQPEAIPQLDTHLSEIHAKAVQTLSPLAHRVDDIDLRNALKTLMQPVPIGSPEKPDRKTMSLDALIQPISNLVLSEARHCGKIVTVSYAADFADLTFEVAETIQDILEAACLEIVSQGIAKSSKTEFGSTPQISLTGQSQGGNVLFSISWTGLKIDAVASSHLGLNTQMKILEQRGGTYSFNKLALSDNLKSRHTLYIKMPIADVAGFNSVISKTSRKVEMGAGQNA
jgi:hypothetical protein